MWKNSGRIRTTPHYTMCRNTTQGMKHPPGASQVWRGDKQLISPRVNVGRTYAIVGFSTLGCRTTPDSLQGLCCYRVRNFIRPEFFVPGIHSFTFRTCMICSTSDRPLPTFLLSATIPVTTNHAAGRCSRRSTTLAAI